MKPLVPMPGAMPRGYSFRLPGDTRKSSQSTESSESEALGRQTSRRELYEYDDYSPEDYKSPHFDGGNEDKYSEQEPVAVAITDASYVSEARESCRPSYASGQQMIALFGGTGVTGGHFMTTALDAGYRVRCTPADDPREVEQPSGWEAIQQSLEDPEQIKEVVCGVDYVVIMLNDVLPGKLDYPAGFMVSFIDRLYTILRSETHVQVVLLQATSLANSVKGTTPILSKVIKTVAHRRNALMQDQDAAIAKIGVEHGLRKTNDENRSVNLSPPNFRFIVTRPSVLLQDGPSNKKLSASKSQPGPFPVAHIDLADFSLGALTTKKMYNTSPYVVADSF